jgi:branched-chain amino acid transport system substrate-binding protein
MKKKMLILASIFFTSSSFAQVMLGQSAALSGPTSALGKGMKAGAEAYFSGNKNIVLKTADDKYEPAMCSRNTVNFLNKKFNILFGYVGTPTSKACAPLAMDAKTIFFGPFTGAGFLSDTVKFPYSFSVRASYDMETEKMVDMLVKSGKKKIAIFIQDDGFGEVGKKGVLAALKKRGLDLTAEGRYSRNTTNVKAGVEKVLAAKPEGVITIGAYSPCAAAIKEFRSAGLNVPVINISFVGSKALAKALGKDAENVYISQVVPNPWDKSLPIVAEYQSKIGKDHIGFISLEGYIAARILDEGLKASSYKVESGDAFKAVLEKVNFDLGGIKATFGPNDHRALETTYMTKVNKDGSFTYVDSL